MADELTATRDELLGSKASEEREKAYKEELQRLEREGSARAQQLLAEWLAEEEKARQKDLKAAENEREKQERTLLAREQEFVRQLEEEERRKKDERRRKIQQAQKQREEEERLQQSEAAEEEGEKEIANVWEDPSLDPVKAEQLRKSREAFAEARDHAAIEQWEEAFIEVSKALNLDPDYAEAAELRASIKEHLQPAGREIGFGTAGGLRKKTYPWKGVGIGMAAVVILAVMTYLLLNKQKYFPEKATVAICPWSVDGMPDSLSYLGTALPMLVAQRLTTVGELQTMGFTSSMNLALAGSQIQSAAGLGFGESLTGALSIHDGKLACKLTLVDSAGESSWSDEVSSALGDAATLPDQIAPPVLHALSLKAGDLPAAVATGTKAGTMDAFMRGLAVLGSSDPRRFEHAEPWFVQAYTIDDHFAQGAAYAAICITREQSGAARDTTAIDTANGLSRQAVSLDPASAIARVSRGEALLLKRDFAGAMDQFETALRAAPNNSDAIFGKGIIQFMTGKTEEAQAAVKSATTLDPRDPRKLTYAACMSELDGLSTEAMAYVDAALKAAPDSTVLLIGPIADIIPYDEDISLAYGDRVAAACARRLKQAPDDFNAMYRLARYEQGSGKAMESLSLLKHLDSALTGITHVRGVPHPDERMALALVQTRLGLYDSAESNARGALESADEEPWLFYKAAQMYAMQMFSAKTNLIDSVKETKALSNLKSAVDREFLVEEIIGGDFYNFHSDAEFKKTVQLQDK